jgi:hypothetical protein
MIDRHYGHLAVDSFAHTVSLLDALALERWTLVDTDQKACKAAPQQEF